MRCIAMMASGIGAALGAYRVTLLCMVCVAAYGLHIGWVQPLFTSADGFMWWVRALVLWPVLVVAFWPTTIDAGEKVCMSTCMLIVSAAFCLLIYGIAQAVGIAQAAEIATSM